ncbi:MAG: hypothetical protein HKO66_09000 [Saprospiraceae bacterium]|nr:hypothetical protein [Saprospiraceae bacterium]
MSLGDLIQFLGDNPYYPVFYFFALPLAAFLALKLAKDEGHLSPWCNFYTGLIYLSVIPGIFSLLLNFYHLLFEKTSIYDVNLLTQFLPIVSMFLTLYLIKKNVEFDKIPGFGKMTGFVSMMAGIMVVFFFLNKARLIAFTYIPWLWVILLLIVVYLVVRYGTKTIFK